MTILKAVSAAIALGLSTSVANAALIGLDWQTAEDNLITRDTNSGLDWLDLTETQGLSYSYVNGQLSSGGTYDGWRYATATEVQNLFGELGVPISFATYYAPITPSITQGLSDAVSYFGDTVGNGTDNEFGILGFTLSSGGYTPTLGVYHIFNGSQVNTRSDGSFQLPLTQTHVEIGSYLVQASPVPVPAAVWLFGSGLLGLIGAAHRKNNP